MLQQSKITAVRIAGLFLLCNVLTRIRADTTSDNSGSTASIGGCCEVKVVEAGDWVEPASGQEGTYILLREVTNPPMASCDDGCIYENTDSTTEGAEYCFGHAMKSFDPTGECNATQTIADAVINSLSPAVFTAVVESLTDEEITKLALALSDLFAAFGLERRVKRDANKDKIATLLNRVFKEGNCTQIVMVLDAFNKEVLKDEDYVSPNCETDSNTSAIVALKKTVLKKAATIPTTTTMEPNLTSTGSMTPPPTSTISTADDDVTVV